MRNLLIGSRALNYWKPEHKIKASTDWDVISDKPIEGTEWHDPEFLNNYKLEKYTDLNDYIMFNGEKLHIVEPLGLAIIKRSHLWRDLSFDKQITMYHKGGLKGVLEVVKGKANMSDDIALLQERTELTMKAFPQQGPNLNMSVEDFFDDAVTKKYSHDWLHELYAYEDKPMYTKLQKDSSTAMCHRDLWYNLTHEQKLQCVAEETYVIATERSLVPRDFSYPYKLAYMLALKKVCTTLCRGYFRDYALDYYPKVLELFNENKVNHVKTMLESSGSNHLM